MSLPEAGGAAEPERKARAPGRNRPSAAHSRSCRSSPPATWSSSPAWSAPVPLSRKRALRAVEEAMGGRKRVFLAARRNDSDAHPGPEDIYTAGTVVRILQV